MDAAPSPVSGQPSPAAGGTPTPRASSARVLAVMVVDDEAPALEAVLAGLASQDHPRTDVMVVDVRRAGDGAFVVVRRI